MPILAGDRVTAAQLNRLQTKTFAAVATSTLAASSTDADIVGASVTFTTETDDAIFEAIGDFQVIWTGAGTSSAVGKIALDGNIQAGQIATRQAPGTAADNGDSAAMSRTWRGTLGTAGSHTIRLVGTTGASQTISSASSATTLTVRVTEVV
jgi:hypothetical protein